MSISDKIKTSKITRRGIFILSLIKNLFLGIFGIITSIFGSIGSLLFGILGSSLGLILGIAIFLLGLGFFGIIIASLYSVQFIPIFSIKAVTDDYGIRNYEYTSEIKAEATFEQESRGKDFEDLFDAIDSITGGAATEMIGDKSINLRKQIAQCRSKDTEEDRKICEVGEDGNGGIKGKVDSNISGTDQALQQAMINVFSLYQLNGTGLGYIKEYSDFCYNVGTIKEQLSGETYKIIDKTVEEKINSFFNKKYLFGKQFLSPNLEQAKSLSYGYKKELEFGDTIRILSYIANKNNDVGNNTFLNFFIDLVHSSGNYERDNKDSRLVGIFVDNLGDSQFFTKLGLQFSGGKYKLPLNNSEMTEDEVEKSRKKLLTFYNENCGPHTHEFIKRNLYFSNAFLLTEFGQEWFTKKIMLNQKTGEFKEPIVGKHLNLIKYLEGEKTEQFWSGVSNLDVYKNFLKNFIYFNNVSLNDNEGVFSVLGKENVFQDSKNRIEKLYHQLGIVGGTKNVKSMINQLNKIEILKGYLSGRYSVLDFGVGTNIYKSDNQYKYITLMNPFPSYTIEINVKPSQIKNGGFFEMINGSSINGKREDVVDGIPYLDINITDFAKKKGYLGNKEIFVKYNLYGINKTRENSKFFNQDSVTIQKKIGEMNPFELESNFQKDYGNLIYGSYYEQMRKEIDEFLKKIDEMYSQGYNDDQIKTQNYMGDTNKVEICRTSPIVVDVPFTVINKNYYSLTKLDKFNGGFPLTISTKKYYQVCVEVDNVFMNGKIYEQVYQGNNIFGKKFFEIGITNNAFVSIKLKDYIPKFGSQEEKQDIYFSNILQRIENKRTKSILFNDGKFCTLESDIDIQTKEDNDYDLERPSLGRIPTTSGISTSKINQVGFRNTSIGFECEDGKILSDDFQKFLYLDWGLKGRKNQTRGSIFGSLDKCYGSKGKDIVNAFNEKRNKSVTSYLGEKNDINFGKTHLRCNFGERTNKKISRIEEIDTTFGVSDELLDHQYNVITLNKSSDTFLKGKTDLEKKEINKKIYGFNSEKTNDVTFSALFENNLNKPQKLLKKLAIYSSLNTIQNQKYDYYFEYLKKILGTGKEKDLIGNILFKEGNKYLLELEEKNKFLLNQEDKITNNEFLKVSKEEEKKLNLKSFYKEGFGNLPKSLRKSNEVFFDLLGKLNLKYYSSNVRSEDIKNFSITKEGNDNSKLYEDNLIELFIQLKETFLWSGYMNKKFENDSLLLTDKYNFSSYLTSILGKKDYSITGLKNIFNISENYILKNKLYKYSSGFESGVKLFNGTTYTSNEMFSLLKNQEANTQIQKVNKSGLNYLSSIDLFKLFSKNESQLEDLIKNKKNLTSIGDDLIEIFKSLSGQTCSEDELNELLTEIAGFQKSNKFFKLFHSNDNQCRKKYLTVLYLKLLGSSVNTNNIDDVDVSTLISKNKLNQIGYEIYQKKIKDEYFNKYNQLLFFDYEKELNDFNNIKKTLESQTENNTQNENNTLNTENQDNSNNDNIKNKVEIKQKKSIYDDIYVKFLQQSKKKEEEAKKRYELQKNSESGGFESKIGEIDKLIKGFEDKKTADGISKEEIENIDKKIKELQQKSGELEKQKKEIQSGEFKIDSTNAFEQQTNSYQLKPGLLRYVKPRLEEEFEHLGYVTYMNPLVSFFKKPPKEFDKQSKSSNRMVIEKGYKELGELEKVFNSFVIYSNLGEKKEGSIQPVFQYENNEKIVNGLFKYFSNEGYLIKTLNDVSELYSKDNEGNTQFKISNDLLQLGEGYYYSIFQTIKKKSNFKDDCENLKYNVYTSQLLDIFKNQQFESELNKNICNNTYNAVYDNGDGTISQKDENKKDELYSGYMKNVGGYISTNYQSLFSNISGTLFRSQSNDLNKEKYTNEQLNRELGKYFSTYQTQFQLFDKLLTSIRTKQGGKKDTDFKGTVKKQARSTLIMGNMIYLGQHSIYYYYHNLLMGLLKTGNIDIFNLGTNKLTKSKDEKYGKIIENSKKNLALEYGLKKVGEDSGIKNILFGSFESVNSLLGGTTKEDMIGNHLENIEKNIINMLMIIYSSYGQLEFQKMYSINASQLTLNNFHNTSLIIPELEKLKSNKTITNELSKYLKEYKMNLRKKNFGQVKEIIEDGKTIKNLSEGNIEKLLANGQIQEVSGNGFLSYLKNKIFQYDTQEINGEFEFKNSVGFGNYILFLSSISKYQLKTLKEGKKGELDSVFLELGLPFYNEKDVLEYFDYYLDGLIQTLLLNDNISQLTLHGRLWGDIIGKDGIINNPYMLKNYYRFFSYETISNFILYMYGFERYHNENGEFVELNSYQDTGTLNNLGTLNIKKEIEEKGFDSILKNNLGNVTLTLLSQSYYSGDKKFDHGMYFSKLLNEKMFELNKDYIHIFNVISTGSSSSNVVDWIGNFVFGLPTKRQKLNQEANQNANFQMFEKYRNNFKNQSKALENSIEKDIEIFGEYLSTNDLLNYLITSNEYSKIRGKINIDETSLETIIKSYIVSEQLNVKNFGLLNELLSKEKYINDSIFMQGVDGLDENKKLNIIAFNYFSYELNKNRMQQIREASIALKDGLVGGNTDVSKAEWEWFMKGLEYIKCKENSSCSKIMDDVKGLNGFTELINYLNDQKENLKNIKDENLRKLTEELLNEISVISLKYYKGYDYFKIWERFPQLCTDYESCGRFMISGLRNGQCVWGSNAFIRYFTGIQCRYGNNANGQPASLSGRNYKGKAPSVSCSGSGEYKGIPYGGNNKIHFQKIEGGKGNLIGGRDAGTYGHIFYIAGYDAEKNEYLILETNGHGGQYYKNEVVNKELRYKVGKHWIKASKIEWMFDLDQPYSNHQI